MGQETGGSFRGVDVFMVLPLTSVLFKGKPLLTVSLASQFGK